MPLQGTIDSFPLADVLSLLDSTARVGRLSVTGNRNCGWVEISEGFVTAAELTLGRELDPCLTVFELLRCTDGEFEFLALDQSELSQSAYTPTLLSELLEKSAVRLERWQEIEGLLPSTQYQVQLCNKLPVGELTVDPFLWSLLVAIQGSSAVYRVVERMGEDELSVCAALASLISEGLAVALPPSAADSPEATYLHPNQPEHPKLISEIASELAADVYLEPEFQTDPASFVTDLHSTTHEPAEELTTFPDHFPIDDLVGSSQAESADLWHRVPDNSGPVLSDPPQEATPVSSAAAAWNELVSPSAEVSPQSDFSHNEAGFSASADEDVFRQMSTLSPQAVAAIAAALSSSPAIEATETSNIVDAELVGPDLALDRAVASSVQSGFSKAAGVQDAEDPLMPISFIGSF